jgi:hypothetical protein
LQKYVQVLLISELYNYISYNRKKRRKEKALIRPNRYKMRLLSENQLCPYAILKAATVVRKIVANIDG